MGKKEKAEKAEKKEEEEIQFVDAESYQGGDGDKLTFRVIVLKYLIKIGNLAAVEYRGGFYTDYVMKDGAVKEIYVPDTREAMCNAIEYLYTILYPYFDKTMKVASDKFKVKKKANEEKFIKASIPEESIILGEIFYKDEKDKLLLDEYKQTKLRLYILLFRYINVFLKESRYLQGKTFEETV